MIELKSKLRKWGNSLGVVVPQNIIESENAQEGDEVVVLFSKEKNNVLREMFGTFKFKKPTEELIKEIDKELYDD